MQAEIYNFWFSYSIFFHQPWTFNCAMMPIHQNSWRDSQQYSWCTMGYHCWVSSTWVDELIKIAIAFQKTLRIKKMCDITKQTSNFDCIFLSSSRASCKGPFSFLAFLDWIRPVFKSTSDAPSRLWRPCPNCFANRAFISGERTRPPTAKLLEPFCPCVIDSEISANTLNIRALREFGAWGCGRPCWPAWWKWMIGHAYVND